METLTLIEHEALPISARRKPGDQALSETHSHLLAKLEPHLPPGSFIWSHRSVKFAQYCGVIALGDLSLEILPKIYGRETDPGACREALIHMLHKARRLKTYPGSTAGIKLQKETLLDIFILHFCDQLRYEMVQGLIRQYIERLENLPVLRGRLRIEQQLKHNLAHRERLYCQYDELSADNLYNQILKFVLRLLLQLAYSSHTRKQVTELLIQFSDISDIFVNVELLNRLTFDRFNNRYKLIFEQCRWFIEGLHPDVVSGKAPCLTLLFDMNRLFEAYVASELRKIAWQQGLRLRTQGPQEYLARRQDTDVPVFMMKPDMAFLDEDNRILAIADAKWKVLDERERKLGISQSDVYQMTSYAGAYGASQLALIYPQQRWLNQSITLQLKGVSAYLSVLPVDLNLAVLSNDNGSMDYTKQWIQEL